MEALAEYLPHFNVVIEAERTAEGLRVPQLYVFDRADMVKISNFIMGLPVNTESPLDEIALSTLKEVASQCMGAAMDDLGDFLGREMGEVLTRVTAFDSAERILDTIRGWDREQQLVLIARAIAQQAGILIMDEPCANLDYGNQARVMEELKRLAGEGYLIVQSTHSPDQAFLYADQAAVLSDGVIKAFGKPEEVLTESLLETMYGIPVRLFDAGDTGRKLCMPDRVKGE